jgi:hypothetical protein
VVYRYPIFLIMPSTQPEFTGNVFSFGGKMDSSLDPAFLQEGQYYAGMNVVSRGGTVQTRPGYATIFNLPCGNLQGFTTFTPTDGRPHLVAVVDGKVYASPSPFSYYFRVPNIQFFKRSKFIAFAECLQTTDYTASGSPVTLQKPRKVLVMQDRNTRAAYWDGGQSRHLNPTPSIVTDSDGNRITQPERDETPVGLWMAWAGNRLWVSRGNEVFASDIGNPLKFTETTYLNEGRAFSMPEDVTGMIQPSSGQPLLVFGQNSITFLKANILDRTLWLSTSDFQFTEYGVGCLAPRSVVNKLGLVWFYSPNGWTNLNYALQTFNDSRTSYLDKEMTFSKVNMSVDKSIVCAGEIEDYLLVSVPSGDKYNKHTWVYDQYTKQPGWDGVWTGTRPIEWSKVSVNGTDRLFYASKDSDGVNRIWEAFQSNRTDNGQPITWWVRGRDHGSNERQWMRFRRAELFYERLFGTTDIAAWFGGRRGAPRKIASKRFVASNTPITYTPSTAYSDDNIPTSVIPQVRYQTTEEYQDNDGTSACESCSVETDDINAIDKQFFLFICGSGRGGIEGYRLYADWLNENRIQGDCETDETGTRALSPEGCGSTESQTITNRAFPIFSATSAQTVSCPGDLIGDDASATVTKTSIISQDDATRKAEGAAQTEALGKLVCVEGGNVIYNDGAG